MTPIERHKAPENPGPNKISFIFYYHAERRYPSDDPLFTLLEDSDLILSELVGLSTKARRKFENDLNLVLLAQENLTPDQIKARGALLTRYPEGLAAALEKISADRTPMQAAARTATAHLWFASPIRRRGAGAPWYAKLFMTHPPVGERVRALRGMEI